MRLYLLISLGICSSAFGQNFKSWKDTTFHSNGQIKSIHNYVIDSTGKFCENGPFVLYDSTGQILLEGEYAFRQIIECVSCFTFENKEPIKYTEAKYSGKVTQVGTWTEYFPNGNIKSKGNYSGSVHEFYYADCTEINKTLACDGLIEVNYLKEGFWEYFDTNGKIIKSETYLNGHLVTETIYQE